MSIRWKSLSKGILFGAYICSAVIFSDITVNAASSISITAPSTVNMSITPTASGTTQISSATINISASNAISYILSVSSASTTLSDGTENIPSTTSMVTLNNMTMNTWGRYFGDTAYNASSRLSNVTTTDLTLVTKNLYEQFYSTNDTYHLSYGIKIDDTVAAGTYTNTQIFSVVAEDTYEATFSYTGAEQVWTVPQDGRYKIELWGAQGGNAGSQAGGLGSYTSGIVTLDKNTNLYIEVGGTGNLVTSASNATGGFNGGGGMYGHPSNTSKILGYTSGGGGATDIRLTSATFSLDTRRITYVSDFNSLKSRIMVAAGGGGAINMSQPACTYIRNGGSAGGLSADRQRGNDIGSVVNNFAYGGGQTQGGVGFAYTSSHGNHTYVDGTFGIGGAAGNYPWGGGGGGYYGGGSGGGCSGPGAGGSSFISGHNGSNAIASSSTASSIIHTNQANHFSGITFTDTVMVDGDGYNWSSVKGDKTDMPTYDRTATMVGNTGNGYAKITYMGQV